MNLIIDSNSLGSRAYFTKNNFYYFTMLRALIDEYEPENIYHCFDSPNFRKDLLPKYKGTRKKDSDRSKYIELLYNVLKDDYAVYKIDGWEADDLVGSLLGKEDICVSGDKDLYQLIPYGNVLYIPRHFNDKHLFTEEMFREKFGFPSNSFVDYKALVGDSGDNFLGCRGIGPVAGTKLIKGYGTLDNIYTHLDTLTPQIKRVLEEGKEDAYLSQNLARIRTEIPMKKGVGLVDLSKGIKKMQELMRL